MNKLIFPLLLLFSGLAAPALAKNVDPGSFAPTDHEHIRRWADIEQAIWPILAANTDLCENYKGYVPGFQAFRDTQDQGMAIYLVGEGSPAESAGLQVGDVITSINGRDVTHKKRGGEAYNEAYEKATESSSPVQINYLRDGQAHQAQVPAVPACNVRILYTGLPTAAGVHEKYKVLILGNHVDLYSTTDEEVRLYVGRELARLFLQHRGQKAKTRKVVGWGANAVGFLTGHAVPTESVSHVWANLRHGDRQAREADYLGLYLVARAGDDISVAPQYWEAVFANRTGNAGVGRLLGNDPPSPERLEGIRLATREILDKQAAGQQLTPQLPDA